MLITFLSKSQQILLLCGKYVGLMHLNWVENLSLMPGARTNIVTSITWVFIDAV